MICIMSMVDHVVISVDIKDNSGCSSKKDFTELIYMKREWYYSEISMRFIHVTIVYVVH